MYDSANHHEFPSPRRQPVNDDDSGPAEHLVHQSQPTTESSRAGVTIERVGPFHGDDNITNSYWRSAAWSPDGSQLAFGGSTVTGVTGILQVWNGESGHHEGLSVRHLTRDVTGAVLSLAWSPDSKRLASVESHLSGRAAVHVRSRAERSRSIDVPSGLTVPQVAWSPDGTLLVLSGRDCPDTVLLDPSGSAKPHVLRGVSGPIAWEPEGKLIAGVDGTNVVLCDPVTGERRGVAAQEHPPTAIAWARHGRYLAVADGEDILVWDVEAGRARWRLPWTTAAGDRGPDGAVAAIEWLDGGGYLLEFRPEGGACRDEKGSTVSTVILWDIATGKWVFVQQFFEMLSHDARGPIATAVLAPDHRRVALAINNRAPVIWRISGDLPHYVP
jgi:WD40 repeat protein